MPYEPSRFRHFTDLPNICRCGEAMVATVEEVGEIESPSWFRFWHCQHYWTSWPHRMWYRESHQLFADFVSADMVEPFAAGLKWPSRHLRGGMRDKTRWYEWVKDA